MPECKSPEVREAADLAVKKTFAILGVNIDNPESVERFRQDLRFTGRLRKAADHGTLVFVGSLVLTITAAIGLGVVELFTRSA